MVLAQDPSFATNDIIIFPIIPVAHPDARESSPNLLGRSIAANWPSSNLHIPIMTSKVCRSRALAQALRPAKPSVQAPRNDAAAARCFSATARANTYSVRLPKDVKNMRTAEREKIGVLEAPIVNPADKYQSKADNLHRYGSWLMGCLPKYVQQFSVWKDELTIYICPSGVIPVFSFLKCTFSSIRAISLPGLLSAHHPTSSHVANLINQTTLPLSLLRSVTSQPSTSLPATSALRWFTTC